MKFAFTGDVCLGDIQKFTDNPFQYVKKSLSDYNIVINLEAPFVSKSFNNYPVKNKISLKQENDSIKYLKQLNPFLVNLSNNHINDYGNYGAENTKKLLSEFELKYFGAGFKNEQHNIYELKDEKILFLSYTTRSTDLSYSKMFNDSDFIGPKEFSFELIKEQIKNYDNYLKIVLLHWGIEDINYPLPEQRIISKKLIDVGVDLVIGNHPHVIQSYEIYKGKWIFYCLGHFFFPNFESHYLNKEGKKSISWDIHSKNRKISIVPIFNLENNSIVLEKIITIKSDDKFEPNFINKNIKHNLFLFNNIFIYSLFYRLLLIFKFLNRIPYRITKKIKRILNY